MFETSSYREMDQTILVYAPINVRIHRVKKRDPFRSEEEIEAIIGKQMDEEQKKELADIILPNYGTNPMLSEILEIHESFLTNSVL
jgi:dephospho-CoA kinase